MSQQVFISHSTKDDIVVDAIRQTLDEQHVLGWIDSRHLQPGDSLETAIETAIREADCFVVVLSPRAIESEWVLKETELARQVRAARPEFRLVPVLIDGIKPHVVKQWLGDDVVAIELATVEPHDLSAAMTELLGALGVDFVSLDDADDEPDQPALSDLILELTRPTMLLQDGKRRPTAQARLVLHPAVGEPVVGRPFPFTAPLGPIETEDLRWYLESFYRWTSDVLRERAKGIEDKLPQWGKLLFQAALGDPAAATVLGPWRRTQPGDQSLRRFTVFVDPAGGEETAHEAATQLLSLPWELLHDPKFADRTAYLFRGARGVRVRRRLPDADVVEPTPAEPPIRVLLVSPRPEDDVASYIDHRISARPVVDALAKLGGLAELTLLDPPTLSALDAELRRAFDAGRPYHVVHFDGHGVYDKRHGLGSLCFEQDAWGELPACHDEWGKLPACHDDPQARAFGAGLRPRRNVRPQVSDGEGDRPQRDEVSDGEGDLRSVRVARSGDRPQRDERRTHVVSADELAAILRDHNIPLFVLEACQSAQAETNPTASVAGRLLACGVSSVIAMSHSVLVETARRFTTVFYRELVRGRRVGQAMLAAQDALFQETFRLHTFSGPLHMQDWFVPVLFQERPDPQLLGKLPTGKMRAAFARARRLNLGELDNKKHLPPHGFVGRSRELLAAERRLCGTRLRPDLGDRDPPRDAPYVVLIGEGGEGKTTLAVELARWLVETQRFDRAAFVSVEHEASAHSVLHQLGDQLVSGWVGQTQGSDERGLKLLRQTLAERSCVLVIDNLESLLECGDLSPLSFFSCAEPPKQPAARESNAGTEPIESQSGDKSPHSKDVLPALFQLLTSLSLPHTRIIFTSRSPLPPPFAEHHLRIGRLSRAEAVELVSHP